MKQGKKLIVIGSILAIASPVSCAASFSGTGIVLFLSGVAFFVVGRLLEE
jgi:hypothetical protein